MKKQGCRIRTSLCFIKINKAAPFFKSNRYEGTQFGAIFAMLPHKAQMLVPRALIYKKAQKEQQNNKIP